MANKSAPGKLRTSVSVKPDSPTAPRTNGPVPPGMVIAGAWSWRLLVLVGAIAVAVWLLYQIRLLVIPVMIAVVLSALLVPFKDFLVRHRWPNWSAITTALLGLIVVVSGLVTLAVTQAASGFVGVGDKLRSSFEPIEGFFINTVGLSGTDVSRFVSQASEIAQQNASALVSGVATIGSSIGHILAGILLLLFTTLFFLIDGPRIWQWTVRIFPRGTRRAVDGAGQAGWTTLQSFVKVQILVAFIDAVGIGLGAALLGVPMALPIGVLVFLGSFIPFVGAIVTGVLAVLVALIFNGWVIALVLLGVVLVVQQVESHVLQPLIMGNAVRVHPLAVVLAVTAGSVIGGIAGAFFAVPFIAMLNVMIKYIAIGSWKLHAPGADDHGGSSATTVDPPSNTAYRPEVESSRATP
jgi:predicted PurR-regulated permease PerM